MLALCDVLSTIQTHWIISLVVVLVSLIYAHYVTYFGEIRRLGLHGPTPLPIIGNFLHLFYDFGQIHITFDRYVKKYGNIFGLYFMTAPGIVVSDPQMIKAICVKEFSSFHDHTTVGYEFPEPIDSMLNIVTGERWKNLRSIVSPAFTSGKLKNIMLTMNRIIDTFLKKCNAAAESGETVDIYQWQQGITMEAILSTAFGIQSEAQSNPDDPVIKYVKNSFIPGVVVNLVVFIPIIGTKIAKYLMPTKYGMGYGELLMISKRIIKERKRLGIENDSSKDILHLMLAAQDPNRKGHKITDDEIAGQSLVFLFAGYDTTSTVLGLISYHLVIYPEVQDKIQEEIDRICPGNEIDYQALHELVFLDAVISETLRLYPPAIFADRKVTKSCEINGVPFLKDMAVIIPIYSLHRDAKYWDEPEEFKPERFLPENKDAIDPYVYQPFGLGPRNCVGMRFAQLEMKLVLVRMLKEFRVERAPELHVPIKMKQRSVFSPDQPVYVKLKKRKE